MGGELQVNTCTTLLQAAPSVAVVAATGDAVIVWQSLGQDGSGFGIFGQRLDSSGTGTLDGNRFGPADGTVDRVDVDLSPGRRA